MHYADVLCTFVQHLPGVKLVAYITRTLYALFMLPVTGNTGVLSRKGTTVIHNRIHGAYVLPLCMNDINVSSVVTTRMINKPYPRNYALCV